MSTLQSWVPVADQSDFSIYNLPYGIFSTKTLKPRVGVAIGDQILDLAGVARAGLLGRLKMDQKVLVRDSLNDFIALGKGTTNKLREKLQQLLSSGRSKLKKYPRLLIKQSDATMHLPVRVGDYTDFYSSIEHATNVGKMFRDPENALLPNWRHLPVGYHGRASSIIVSGTPIHRPKGQVLPRGKDKPVYQPSGSLDFELEMAFIIGKENKLGHPVPVQEAEDYIFGLVLFNDWSARDIQRWEYVPLGPFLGKSFASTVSPWVVPLEALEPFRVRGPKQEPKVLPYLRTKGKRNFNIRLEAGIIPHRGKETVVCQTNFRYMYWNMSQQLAHHTVNGCNMRLGDMCASGTISGKDEHSYGSMLELAWAGTKPVNLEDGSTRIFLEDYDTVTMRGYARKGEIRVGFGEVRSTLLPALKF